MNLPLLSAAAPATMTSREIADLTGKRHDNVMRDTRSMLVELHGEGGLLTFEDTQRNDQNGQMYPIYRLPKRETLILVSGYSVELRARIIDRWQELEAAQQQPMFVIPASFAEALRLAADNAERADKAEAAVEQARPLVEAFNRIAGAEGSFCLTDAAKALQMRPIDLRRELHERGWIYRRPGSGRWIGHGIKERQGLLTHKVTTGTKADGTEWSDEQVRMTPKGLAKIAIALNAKLDDAA